MHLNTQFCEWTTQSVTVQLSALHVREAAGEPRDLVRGRKSHRNMGHDHLAQPLPKRQLKTDDTWQRVLPWQARGGCLSISEIWSHWPMCVFTWQSVSGCTTRHRKGLETAKLPTGPVSLSALLLEGTDGRGAAWHTVGAVPPVGYFICSRKGSQPTQGLNIWERDKQHGWCKTKCCGFVGSNACDPLGCTLAWHWRVGHTFIFFCSSFLCTA